MKNVIFQDFWNFSKKSSVRAKSALWECFGRFFAIFKMHVLESGVIIFAETPLNWSTIEYYKLMQLQLLCSFVSQKNSPLNMAINRDIPSCETGKRDNVQRWNFLRYKRAQKLSLHQFVVLCSTSIQWSFSEFGRSTFEYMHFENQQKNSTPKKTKIIFSRFSKCMSSKVVWSFSLKLHWIEVL